MKYPDCPVCGIPMVLKQSKFGPFLGCQNWPKCDMTHCVHKKTLEPMGIPAGKETREWRMTAHKHFDEWWRLRQIPRTRAYEIVSKELGIPMQDCHISRFDAEQCKKLVVWLFNYIKQGRETNV